jgi:hypothetical protein
MDQMKKKSKNDRILHTSKITWVKDESEMSSEERWNKISSLLATGVIRLIQEKEKVPERKSVNSITLAQLKLSCRHTEEMLRAGVTENMAIRTLELFVDVYSKILMGGSATPHHVREIKHWSKAALKLKSPETLKKAGSYFRVEHGTPRRELARKVLAVFLKKKLDQQSLDELVRNHWKLAVITLEEDVKLARIARSKGYDTPDARWAAAEIEF